LSKKRIIILNTAIIFGFFAVFFRLTDLMILNHTVYREKAKSQQTKAEDIQIRRGTIYDRQGREFAVDLEKESFYCNPKVTQLDSETMMYLSNILGMQPKAIRTKFRSDKKFAWINRKLSSDVVQKIRNLEMKGCGFLPEVKRFYPKGNLASHIIGAVGLDNQPLEGIELGYDRYLKTSGGKVFFSRDASGRMLSSGVEMEAKGNNILLTIDEGLQYIVEREIENAMVKWKPVAASVVMMDPFTGEILALANRPTYDPNEIRKSKRNSIRNRMITDIYEPGSTFKMIIGSAALEEDIFDPTSIFDCSKGSIVVGGKTIHDVHKEGLLTFSEVIQKSSNVGSIMIGMAVGKEKIYEYAKRLGFGESTGIDLPGEVSGWIRKPGQWSGTSIGAVSIGQEIAATPLQIARAYAAVANGGYLVQPHVVSEIRAPDGERLYSFEQDNQVRVISSETARLLKEILKKVVEEGGTATNAAIDGNQVAGKTGTAQLIDKETKKYSKDRFVSSFVGFVPADNPRIALIVVVHEPKGKAFGGVVAAPVFRNIVDKSLSYMNVPRDDTIMNNVLLVSK
jgi:cell division protein FtsI (penicillin-binding protein 3)